MTTTVQIQLRPQKTSKKKPYIRIYFLFAEIFFPMLLPTNSYHPPSCETPMTVCLVSHLPALAHARLLSALLKKVDTLLMRTTLPWSTVSSTEKPFALFSSFRLNKLFRGCLSKHLGSDCSPNLPKMAYFLVCFWHSHCRPGGVEHLQPPPWRHMENSNKSLVEEQPSSWFNSAVVCISICVFTLSFQQTHHFPKAFNFSCMFSVVLWSTSLFHSVIRE